jgi:hypothetical protein
MADDPPKPFDLGSDKVCPIYDARLHPGPAEALYAYGAAQDVVAGAFGVSIEEISDWEADHAEFYDACERGRAAAANKIESALLKLAIGSVQSGERPMKVHGEIVMVPYHRQISPNAAAIRMLNKGTTAQDSSEARARQYLRVLKPGTVFGKVAENEEKQKKEIDGDD